MKYKDVLLMAWGKSLNDIFIKKQKIKLPKQTIVTFNWDEKDIKGVAKKFKHTKEGITCDVELNKKTHPLFKTVSPVLKSLDEIKIINKKEIHLLKNIEIIGVSIIPGHHAYSKCNDNLK